MLSFKELSEKKTKVTINPKLDDLKENHGEDCDCMKCEKKRRSENVHDGPDVANESAVPGKPAERLKTDRNMFSIDKDERAAAAERLKAKAAAKRAEREKLKDSKGMKEGYYDPMEDPDFDHDEAERTRGQSGKPAKKKTKKSTKKEEVAYVSQEEVSEESDQSIEKEETSGLLTFGQYNEGMKHAVIKGAKGAVKGAAIGAGVGAGIAATGGAAAAALPAAAAGGAAGGAARGGAVSGTIGAVRSDKQQDKEAKKAKKESMSFEDFVSALNEGRAEDAKKSLEAVKKRQGVLDAHEKKTGKKLDITKTPEHKAHKQNFPGAKRQAKKVKGAKETPAEKHSRQVQTYTDRLKKYGKTKKQAAYDKAMSKQTSRFD